MLAASPLSRAAKTLYNEILRLWQQASPWRSASSGALSELQRQIAELLLTGLDQVDIAARLGMNEHTLAGHVAEMKALLGATTLFQLGAELARGTPG
jgi:DNA-binding CsgD family transcriptional regulator